MSLKIISMVNPIGSIKTWGKPSCILCMKVRIEIINRSWCSYSLLINAWSEVYKACHHIPILNRFTRHWRVSYRWKSHVLKYPKMRFDQNKNGFWLNDIKISKMRISTPLGGYFSVRETLNFSWFCCNIVNSSCTLYQILHF